MVPLLGLAAIANGFRLPLGLPFGLPFGLPGFGLPAAPVFRLFLPVEPEPSPPLWRDA